jgi:Putative nuclear envelope organisation protein
MSSASASVSSGASTASASAASTQAYLSDMLFEAWSDSKLKEFLDAHGIPIPQGSNKIELIALARKHRASLMGNAASMTSVSGASAYGAATSKAGNAYAKATDDASMKAEDLFNSAIETWSNSRLKAYLDSRGVPIPQGGKRDQLLASVHLNKHKAATGWSAWTFDTWSIENLQKFLSANSKKVKKNAGTSRDELVKQAQNVYVSASKAGSSNYASVTRYLVQQTEAVKDATFDAWSESDLKSYLDSYGVPNHQGSSINDLRAMAKKQMTYFRYGTATPQGTIFEQLKGGVMWILQQIQGGAAEGKTHGSAAATSAASRAAASTASFKMEV